MLQLFLEKLEPRLVFRGLRCLLLVMCTYPFAKKALTLHLACGEGRERYFGCNSMQRKVLASSHQHLMAEAPIPGQQLAPELCRFSRFLVSHAGSWHPELASSHRRRHATGFGSVAIPTAVFRTLVATTPQRLVYFFLEHNLDHLQYPVVSKNTNDSDLLVVAIAGANQRWRRPTRSRAEAASS